MEIMRMFFVLSALSLVFLLICIIIGEPIYVKIQMRKMDNVKRNAIEKIKEMYPGAEILGEPSWLFDDTDKTLKKGWPEAMKVSFRINSGIKNLIIDFERKETKISEPQPQEEEEHRWVILR